MKLQIPTDYAVPVRRAPGATVTFINQSAVDVYFDRDPNRLNSVKTGDTPDGTKLAANGGQLQWAQFPGTLWFRAAAATTIEVQP
jgi:hypothetical protein